MSEALAAHNIDYIKSVKNKKWVAKNADSYLVESIARATSLPNLISYVMSFYVDSPDIAKKYMDPKLKDLLLDPYVIKDMQEAVTTTILALSRKQKIVIYGDYDVDGATSASLLKNFFFQYGYNVDTYIPDRIKEGYGLNTEAIYKLKNQSYELIITVDCGSTSYTEIEKAKELGIDVIVIDHHKCSASLPKANAIVNPNRQDDTSGYTYLAAVGVSFFFALALNRELQKLEQHSETKINMMTFLDLVALGTVCDVVPLIGLNRALVRQGIKVIKSFSNIGIKALTDIAGINSKVSTYHLGYVLGPRINAGGRVGESRLGVDLLSNNNYEESISVATKLDLYNNERKLIENLVLEEAKSQALEINKNSPIIIVSGENWHPGVIGIVASRIKEIYNKPTAVISIENGIGKASCRSIEGIDFGSAVISAKDQGLLVNGGGHAMAAGFTVNANKISDLNNFLSKIFLPDYNLLKDQTINYYTAILPTKAIDVELVTKINNLGPFGSGCPQPKFLIKNVRIINPQILKNAHISCYISGAETHMNNKFIKAIAFSAIENPLGEVLLSNQPLSLIVTLDLNTWQGMDNAQVTILDATK